MLLAIMKLIRTGPVGSETPGVMLSDGSRIDVSPLVNDFDEAFFASDGVTQLQRWVVEHAADAARLDASLRLGAPLARPSKIVCIGLNFRDHAAESGMPTPAEPVIFFNDCCLETQLTGANRGHITAWSTADNRHIKLFIGQF